MTRRLGRVVAKVLLVLLFLGQQLPGHTESAADFNHVVSVVEDISGNLVLINTSKKTHIAAPTVQYLPGPDVGTVLVADFPGLLWKEPSRTITPRQKWIKSIHIGQFQDNPPVLRIAVRTDEPKLLRNLAFRSSPGVLVVKWASASNSSSLKADGSVSDLNASRPAPRLAAAPSRSTAPAALKPGSNRQSTSGTAPVKVELWSPGGAGQSRNPAAAAGPPSGSLRFSLPPAQKSPIEAASDRPPAKSGNAIAADPDIRTAGAIGGAPVSTNAGRQPVVDGATAMANSVGQLRGAIPVESSTATPPVAPPVARSVPVKPVAAGELPGRATTMPPAAPSSGARSMNQPAARKASARPAEVDAKSESAAQPQTDSNPERRSGRFMSSLKRIFGPVKEKTEDAENSIARAPTAKADPAGKPAGSKTPAVPAGKDDRIARASSSDNAREGQSTVGLLPPDPLSGRPASPSLRAPGIRSVPAGTSQAIDSKVENSGPGMKQQPTVAAHGATRSPEGGANFEASRNSNEQGPLDANARALTSGSANPGSANPNLGLPKVTVSGVSPLKLELESDKPLSYKSFRLHNPERYVVDIQTGADLRNVSMPALEPNGFLQSIRVGSPDNDTELSRLVLDLSTADVDVSDSADDSKRILSLLVGKLAIPAQLGKAPGGQTVVLDAGHGGSDPGAQRGDIQEKEITLQIAARVKKLLETGGVKVVMTRGEDTAVTLEERVVLTNNVQPDVFLSVHINSLEANSTIHGIETYYQTDQSRPLAQLIHAQLVGKLEAPDRNIRKARFYVINHTPVPAVLAEVGFISNKEERTKLISVDYQNQVANALAQGVILYLSQRNDLAAAGTAKSATGTTRSGIESQDSANRPAASLAQSGAAAPKTAR